MEDYCEHVIYEKNPEVGGTWYENQYPGVACDVPAHIYAFTWAPNPSESYWLTVIFMLTLLLILAWSQYYAKGPEIRQYIQKVAKAYNLEKNIVFNAKVLNAAWIEEEGKWEIEVNVNGHIKRDKADVVINASGILK
jgi:cation diffusion facilitator CzcD-associated flavoprotein CzcO